jgi:hypothetical protein
MKPDVVFLRILAVITVAELVTMSVLAQLGMKGGAYILADTVLLILLSAPFIHLWVVNGAVRASAFEAFLTKATLQQEEAMREKRKRRRATSATWCIGWTPSYTRWIRRPGSLRSSASVPGSSWDTRRRDG